MIDRKRKVYYINKEYSIYADAFHDEVLHLVYNGELNRTSNGKVEEIIINTYYPETYTDIFDDVMFFDKVKVPTKPKKPTQKSGENKLDDISYETKLVSYNKLLDKYQLRIKEFNKYRRNFYDEMAEAGYYIKISRLNLKEGL